MHADTELPRKPAAKQLVTNVKIASLCAVLLDFYMRILRQIGFQEIRLYTNNAPEDRIDSLG